MFSEPRTYYSAECLVGLINFVAVVFGLVYRFPVSQKDDGLFKDALLLEHLQSGHVRLDYLRQGAHSFVLSQGGSKSTLVLQ